MKASIAYVTYTDADSEYKTPSKGWVIRSQNDTSKHVQLVKADDQYESFDLVF